MSLGLHKVGLAVLLGILTADGRAQTTQAPYRWLPIPIVAGGYVPGIVFHPAQKGLIYARTDIGGAYRWDNAAKRWVPLLDWVGLDNKNDLGVEGLALDPNDASKLYLAVGEYTQSWAPNGAVLRSSDQGRTFQRAPLPFKLGGNEDGRGANNRLSVDPVDGNVLYLGTRRDGLWRSRDGAATWSRVDSFPVTGTPGIGIVAVIPVGGKSDSPAAKDIYAAASSTDGGLFHSVDGGETWRRVPKQPQGLLITNTALGPDGMLYLTYGTTPGPMGETDGAAWRLELATGKWTDITPVKPNLRWPDGTSSPSFGYGGVAVSVDHPNTLLVSTLDRWDTGDAVFRSTDGGKHWADIAGGQQPRFVGLSPWLNHAKLLHGTGSWPTTLAIDPSDSNHVLFSTGETVWETHEANALEQNHPVRWTVGANGIEETAVLALLSPPAGPHLFSAVRDIGGFRHDDLGQSPRAGSFKNPEFADTSGLAFAALDPNLMVRVGGSWTGSVFGATSSDQGVTWTPFATQPAGTKGSGSVAMSANGKAIVWAGVGAPPRRIDRHGKAMDHHPRGPQRALVVADPVDPARFFSTWRNRELSLPRRTPARPSSPTRRICPRHSLTRHPTSRPFPGTRPTFGSGPISGSSIRLHQGAPSAKSPRWRWPMRSGSASHPKAQRRRRCSSPARCKG